MLWYTAPMNQHAESVASNPIAQPGVEAHTVPARTQPITSDQCLRHEDARWARHDREVLVKFRGQFVVPYLRQIVAHGHVVQDVLDEAARVTGRKPEQLPICHIDDPLHELPH